MRWVVERDRGRIRFRIIVLLDSVTEISVIFRIKFLREVRGLGYSGVRFGWFFVVGVEVV